jgi:hypothetical protein
LAIADISRIAHAHLPSAATVTDRRATQSRLLLPIPLDLFALFASAARAQRFLPISARFRYDAVQQRGGQSA